MTVFVNKGDAPLTNDQLADRTQAIIDRDWPAWKRERATRLGDDASLDAGENLTALNTYMAQVAEDTDVNRANNLFNQQLVDYRAAVARLEQVELSVGREAYTEQVDTGEMEWDEEAKEMVPVMQTVERPAVEPMPATIESVDENGDPVSVPNPIVANDEAERAAAQSTIDATPAEVKAF